MFKAVPVGLFDAAYEAFITEPNIPHSIYEIEGAKDVAIEFRSYSETAGLTGLRCGYCVVPKELMLETKKDDKVSANELWKCHQRAKFKGCSYIFSAGQKHPIRKRVKIIFIILSGLSSFFQLLLL